MLISEETPKDYVKYLRERNYDFHIAGKKYADLRQSLTLLSQKYDAKTVLTDTGRTLGNLPLNQGLVSDISLLIHPIIVGNQAENLFSNITNNIKLKLYKQQMLGKGYVWLVYKVEKFSERNSRRPKSE